MIGLREDQQMKVRLVDYLNHATAHCGSGLARESGVPVNEFVTEKAAIAGKSNRRTAAPTVDRGEC